MDESESELQRLDRAVIETARIAGELLVLARLERDHQQDAGQDIAWLDRLIRELEPLAEQTHDLETIVAIR